MDEPLYSAADRLLGRKRKQPGKPKPWMPYLIVGLIGAAIALAFVIVVEFSTPTVAKLMPAGLGNAKIDPDRQAVRAWLKENLGEPEWEEVRWWGPVPDQERGYNLMRLKYRAGPRGNRLNIDAVFAVKNGEAVLLNGHDIEYWSRNLLDDPELENRNKQRYQEQLEKALREPHDPDQIVLP